MGFFEYFKQILVNLWLVLILRSKNVDLYKITTETTGTGADALTLTGNRTAMDINKIV